MRRERHTAAVLLLLAAFGLNGAVYGGETEAAAASEGQAETEAVTEAGTQEMSAEEWNGFTTVYSLKEGSQDQLDEAKAMDTSAVADASDMSGVEKVGVSGREPVTPDQLKDGSYDIDVQCSSKMFVIDRAVLTVDNGSMYVDMKLDGTGYLFLYPGTAKEAAKADAEQFVYNTEAADGKFVYMHFPLEALDTEVQCAAFSKKKQQWYPRTLFFDSASVDPSAFARLKGKDPAEMGLQDGTYTAGYSFSAKDGGKTPKISAMELSVKDGKMTARMTMAAAKYDYVKTGGVQYDTVEDGSSVFEFPVSVLDAPISITIDSNAIAGKQVEQEYALVFDSSTLQLQQETEA